MFIARGKRNITQQLHDRVNSLLRIGEKKVKEKNHGQPHFNPNRAEGIHSIATTKAVRSTAQRLSEVAKEKQIRNIEDIDKSVLDAYMARYKDASPFTIAKECSNLNKLFSTHYVPKDFGFLEKRTLACITHNRGDLPPRSTSMLEKNQVQMDFIRGTGARRESLGRVCAKDFVWSKDGKEVVGVFLKEKNGRERYAPVRLEYRSGLSEMARNAASPTKPMMVEPDRHCGCHRARAEYARSLYEELKSYKDDGNKFDLYDGRKFELFVSEERFNRGMEHPRYSGDTVKGYDQDILLLVSEALGHSRIDVLWNYLSR